MCVYVCLVPGLCPYFQPFYQPNECGKALCVRPDMMELDELYEFPEFSRDPTMYLALRNLILAAWHRDCKVQRNAHAFIHLFAEHVYVYKCTQNDGGQKISAVDNIILYK